jgi:hypothetical protein
MAFVTTTISFSGMKLDGLAKALDNRVLGAIIAANTNTLQSQMRKNHLKNKSVWRGKLLINIRARNRSSIKEAVVDIGPIDIDYGLNVELGSPAHRPDRLKLIRWSREKLGSTNPILTASHVSRVIESKGTNKAPFIVPAWKAQRKATAHEIFSGIERHLRMV